jgi:hypothetical protein
MRSRIHRPMPTITMLRRNGIRHRQARNWSPETQLKNGTARFARNSPAGPPNCGQAARRPRFLLVRAHSIYTCAFPLMTQSALSARRKIRNACSIIIAASRRISLVTVNTAAAELASRNRNTAGRKSSRACSLVRRTTLLVSGYGCRGANRLLRLFPVIACRIRSPSIFCTLRRSP